MSKPVFITERPYCSVCRSADCKLILGRDRRDPFQTWAQDEIPKLKKVSYDDYWLLLNKVFPNFTIRSLEP